ncbi:MAG: TonB C-terminal domain-containing protein [Endomicrobium sp.]|jgi:TonB family protein|nr:TonB C-terminal domain-containing protein [Endomicrobium sp.]
MNRDTANKRLMTNKDKLFPYLLVSIFFHLIFIYLIFNVREKPMFLSVPIEVSFYSKPQDELVDRSEIMTFSKKSKLLNTKYENENKTEIFSNHSRKEDIVIKKEKQENYVMRTSENSNNVKEFQPLNPTKIPIEATSQYGVGMLSFDTPDFKYSYYAGEVVKKISKQWKWVENYCQLTVIVYFKIHRNGSISNISIKKSSGNSEYDKYALDTIQRAMPFPDLPEDYVNNILGVYFEFKCKD